MNPQNFQNIFLLCFTLTCAVLVKGVLSIDQSEVDKYREAVKCTDPKTDPNFDADWASSVPVFYTTFGSKAELYRISEKILGREKFQKLTEEDMKLACIYYNTSSVITPTYGFGTKYTYHAHLNVARNGVIDWTTVPDEKGNKEYLGSSYITLSDNKNGVVIVTIWTDGLKGFTIASTAKTVPPEFFKRARQHAIDDLGFNPEFFFNYSYDPCEPFIGLKEEL